MAVCAVLLHGLVAVGIWQSSSLPAVPQEQAPLMVSLISDDARQAPPEPPVKPPEPPAPKPVVQPKPQPKTPPVLASNRPAAPQEMQVPVQPAKPVPAEVAPPPTPAAPTAAPAAVASAPEPTGPKPTLNLPSSAVRFLTPPKPPYPPASKELGETGAVTMMLLIDENGHVKDIKVTQSSGFPRLDRAALAAYSVARFYPHIVNGVPRSVLAPATIAFTLDER